MCARLKQITYLRDFISAVVLKEEVFCLFLKAVAVMLDPRLSSVRLQSRHRAILDDYYGFKIGELISH